ncbi:MAG: DEAD/DEAH box helicase [Sedimentisphaerales bacterium]
MINILYTAKGYNIIGGDAEGKNLLFSPLHRLFFRGSLTGDQVGEKWVIPFGENASATLQRLIRHLEKYNITFGLDEKSSDVLRAVVEARHAYEEILQKGQEAKKQLTKGNLHTLRKLLTPGFKRELTKLQFHGVYHLLKIQNGANLSVPGSGKTSIVLAYYHILRMKKQLDAILVIGPGSCFEPWETESRACFKKAPKILRLAGKPMLKRRENYILADQFQILLTTYHSAARDVEYLLRVLRRRNYLIVLDESHYVKRPRGGVLAEAVLRLAPYAKNRIILTGTPMPNSLADLWTQFTFLCYDQLPLGTAESYLWRIQEQEKEEALADTRRTLTPLFFRITKSELALPRPTFNIIKCRMSPLQARIYRGVAAHFLIQTNEAPKDRETLREWRRARAVRLLQIASNPTLLLSSCDEFQLPPLDLKGVPLRDAIEHYYKYELPSKIEYTCRIVRDICEEGQKVIVWSTFVHNLKMIAKQLKDLSPVVVHGGIPLVSSSSEDFDRESLIQKFKSDPNVLVFVANPAACAESISLHKACHNAIYLDRSFNCAHYIQSLDRIHRLGLNPNDRIAYHLILANDTIDETVHFRLQEKMQNMSKVIEGSFPTELPGYWSEDLGAEEELDFELVEKHIRTFVEHHERKA